MVSCIILLFFFCCSDKEPAIRTACNATAQNKGRRSLLMLACMQEIK